MTPKIQFMSVFGWQKFAYACLLMFIWRFYFPENTKS